MPQDSTSSLTELQKQFDASAYNLNRRLVRLLIVAQNDLHVPASEYAQALIAVQAVKVSLHAVETWIGSNASTPE